MAVLKPYYFGPDMLQNPKMKALKLWRWIIAWKKQFTDLVNGAKPVAGFSPYGVASHKEGLSATYSSKWPPSEMAFSRQIFSEQQAHKRLKLW